MKNLILKIFEIDDEVVRNAIVIFYILIYGLGLYFLTESPYAEYFNIYTFIGSFVIIFFIAIPLTISLFEKYQGEYFRASYLHANKYVPNENEIAKFKKIIAKTNKPYFQIKATPSNSYSDAKASKFGGFPYLINLNDIPDSKKNGKLKFLAQINFSELPKNDIYPDKGILQFFINNELYLDDFKVIYREDISKSPISLTNEQIKEIQCSEVIFVPEVTLKFIPKKENISIQDFTLRELFKNTVKPDLREDKELYFTVEQIEELNFSNKDWNHKLGGSFATTQYDPRVSTDDKLDKPEEYELLLQIVTQQTRDKYDLMWGDSGVGHFFIKKSDLEAKKFDKVFFSWDCY